MKAFVMKKINETGIVDKEIPAVGPYDALTYASGNSPFAR